MVRVVNRAVTHSLTRRKVLLFDGALLGAG
jgi:hypothetical protein